MFYYRRSLFVSHTHPPKRIATPRSFYTIPEKKNFIPRKKKITRESLVILSNCLALWSTLFHLIILPPIFVIQLMIEGSRSRKKKYFPFAPI